MALATFSGFILVSRKSAFVGSGVDFFIKHWSRVVRKA